MVPEAGLVRAPAALPGAEAAAIWQGYLTAYGPLVEHGRAQPGQVVLVTAAASGVGLAAVQLARRLGCTVIGTTRTPAKAQAIRDAGADHVLIADGLKLAPQVHSLTGGRGFDLALDPVAGPGVGDLVEAAAPEAAIFLYGQLAPEPASLPLIPMLRKGVTIRGYTLWEITLRPERRDRAVRFILEQVEAGALRPVIDRRFPLAAVVEAHRYLETGRQTGKILLTVADDA